VKTRAGLAGPVGGRRLELVEAVPLAWDGESGLWRSAVQLVCQLERGRDRGRVEPWHRARGQPRTLARVDLESSGSSQGRGRWLQRVSVASTALPPKVGDAGNGYSTSSHKVWFCCSRIGVGGRIERSATGRAARVVGLGVGTPEGTRDNRSRLQRLVRGISFGCVTGGNAEDNREIAVDGDPLP
jgi:hypothetical protein